jgi:hypothetical protein
MKTSISSLAAITMFYLVVAVAPSMADTLYSNGPYNGTVDAWTINFGFEVSDSFTLPPGSSSIEGLHFVYWDTSATDVLTTVDMAISVDPIPVSGFQTLTGVTNTFLGINQFGYALFQADYLFANIPWSGPGWVTLMNACTTSGCSVVNPIYWDENDGPSMATNGSIGSIPSEAFTLTGTSSGGTTPEPSTILLFGSGVLALGRAACRKSGIRMGIPKEDGIKLP